jgi:hypothetical protein
MTSGPVMKQTIRVPGAVVDTVPLYLLRRVACRLLRIGRLPVVD